MGTPYGSNSLPVSPTLFAPRAGDHAKCRNYRWSCLTVDGPVDGIPWRVDHW